MQPVDPNKLAELHLCVKCRKLPKSVVAATDENLYCRTCIEGVLSAASSGDIIQSPATGEVIGRKLTTPVTIQALINDLMACGNLDKKYVWSDSEDANSSSVFETIQKAKAGSARHMTILGRWYLFGEKEGIEGNEDEAYKWCKQADNLDDVDGKVCGLIVSFIFILGRCCSQQGHRLGIFRLLSPPRLRDSEEHR